MNEIERALMYAIDVHPHHNVAKEINFGMFDELIDHVHLTHPGRVIIGPSDDDDAGVTMSPSGAKTVSKLESHNSPSAVEPYGSAATCASGVFRDIVAMGARPYKALDYLGTPEFDTMVIVGPCALEGDGTVCTCGQCEEMTVGDRTNLSLKGILDMCKAMGVPIVGGCLSTSLKGPVPSVSVAAEGELVAPEPLTKSAKNVGDKLILIGYTSNDGNDTAYRAGLADKMRPAEPLFEEERISMEGALSAFRAVRVNACSDLGAAGIGAAVCESIRKGELGARVDLSLVPLLDKAINNTHGETVLNETQGRYLLQVNPGDVNDVLGAIQFEGAIGTVIGEITDGNEAIFVYGDDVVATIPNSPSEEILAELRVA